jgi:hypothetical protein
MQPIGQIIIVKLIEWSFPIGNSETIGVAVIFSNKEVIFESESDKFWYFFTRLKVYSLRQ